MHRITVAAAMLVVLAMGMQTGGLMVAEAQKMGPKIVKTAKAPKAATVKTKAVKSNLRTGVRHTAPGVKLRGVLGKKGAIKTKTGQALKSLGAKLSVGKTAKTTAQSTTGAKPTKLSRAERREAKAKAKEAKAKDRIIPERKAPIHQKLKDPNFFGEKEAIASEPTVESLGGAHAALRQLDAPSNHFLSGDVGRLMAARFINRGSRNDADFRYAYGQQSFKNFAKADAILRSIPEGELAKNFDVALLTKVNQTAFAAGGDGWFTTLGKSVRNVFMPGAKSKAGQIRNYQSYHFESKGLSKQEAENMAQHGARFVKLPFLKAGWIVYAKPNTVKPKLDALIASTKAKLNDPAADPVETAGEFVQKFIAIHPFADGNGRTARLMMDRMLAEKGLAPPILKNTGNDIGLSSGDFAKEVLHGVARTNKMLGIQTGTSGSKDLGPGRLHSGAGYVARMMQQHGHTLKGEASTTFAKHDGLRYALGQDGFVYNSAGRPHLADKQGNLRPLGQMTLYILMRRIAQRKNAPEILEQITAPTRKAFENMLAGKPAKSGKSPVVHSDLGAIKSDGSLSVDLAGIDSKMLISLLNPTNVDTSVALSAKRGDSSVLTTIMSRYQQADLELWYVKEAFDAKGDKASVAKIEKHRDVLFARARAELRKHVKKGTADDDNPLGAKQEYERIQYSYSPLRYAKRSDYTKKHGDSEAYVFRGENFAKWTGVHIDAIPFRPGLKDAAGLRASRQGSLNLFDALDEVQRDTVGTGVQSYTTDLALLARKGGFADQHKSLQVNLGAMPKIGKALVNMRLKEGEVLEVKSNTSLLSALFSRKIATRPGHFSVDDIGAKELHSLIEAHAPAEAVAQISKRVADARATRKGPLSRITSIFGTSRRKEVKVDDLMSEGQLSSFNNALSRARNLITVRREGDNLNVTAHRRANVFKVKKSKMLPGTDSLAGTFIGEQEVHVMSSVLPTRILETFTQGHLAAEVSVKDAAKATKQEVGTPVTKVSATGSVSATGTL